MKKVFSLLLAAALILGACSNGNSGKDSEKVNVSKVQYKNNTIVLNQAVLYLKDAFILNNTDNGKKEIVFKYEVKNKTNKEEITPSNVFLVAVQAKQDNDNTTDNLNTGTSLVPSGKYKEWMEHSDDVIKKDKIAKGMSAFELKNDKKVILNFTQGMGGKKLGSKEYDLSKLKTVDYSSEQDSMNSMNNTQSENTTGSTDSQFAVSNEPKVNQSYDNTNVSNVANSSATNTNKADNGTSAQNTENQQVQTHSGGHPSAFGKTNVPVGVEKKDSNGETYIDATAE